MLGVYTIFHSGSVSEQEQAYPAIYNCHRLICESVSTCLSM